MGSVKVIAFTGMPGSGKSEAVRVAREQGAQVLRMGDAVWEEVKRRGLPLEAAEVGRIATEMRGTEGPEVWARRTLEAVDRDATLVVVDGVRTRAEINAFREALGDDFLLVLVECPEELRLDRVTSRRRDDDTMTREDFHARDRRELGWGLGEVLALADVVIDNAGTLEELRSSVERLLDEASEGPTQG